MAEPPRILIAGGYGIFGMHLARELLASTDAKLILAGRDGDKAGSARLKLGALERTETLSLDLADPPALERAASGCFAVSCTAGPFQTLPRDLPHAAVRAGAHWLDISDDPGWVLSILDDHELNAEAQKNGVCVMPGASAVPAISGVLARWCRSREPAADRARVTLFIGNRNAKGPGATASALISPFSDPQGVDLPLGRKTAYRFETPDTELLSRDLGLQAAFRVALEWGYLGRLTATIGRVARSTSGDPVRLARALSKASRPLSRLGTDLGCVQVDLWSGERGPAISAAALAGQPLVILPCAISLGALMDGSLERSGIVHPASWLEPDVYLERLRAKGVRFFTRGRSA